jgi:hypothetical protein
MKKKQHTRSALVKFYPWGLGGKNEVASTGWSLKTLGTIMKQLGHENVSSIHPINADDVR